jgi:hypothetical protein
LKERLENEKWSVSETIQLIDSLEKNGENWEEIVKVIFILTERFLVEEKQSKIVLCISCNSL